MLPPVFAGDLLDEAILRQLPQVMGSHTVHEAEFSGDFRGGRLPASAQGREKVEPQRVCQGPYSERLIKQPAAARSLFVF